MLQKGLLKTQKPDLAEEELKRAGAWECVRREALHLLTLFFSSLLFHFQEPVVAVLLFWDF